MRVVTWNIRYGVDVPGAIATLRDEVAVAGAELILLQEMDEAGVATIASALDRDYAYGRASVHRATGRDFGNAILASGPLGDVELIDLPHKARWRGEPRRATVATVQIGGEEVRVASVHTEVVTLGLAKRAAQFRRVADHLAAPARAVVGGDFNTASRRSATRLSAAMAIAGLEHATTDAAVTFRRFGRGFRMDHVFSTGFTVVDTGVVTTSSSSDHRPVWVEFSTARPGARSERATRSTSVRHR